MTKTIYTNENTVKPKKTAVLLISFNRVQETEKVLDKIIEADIAELYFFNDAPREGNRNDKKARNEIMKLIDKKQLNSRLLLHTLFPEKNLGCGPGPVKAISWAFENQDKLIILEDDCVPSLSFFTFCDYLLEKYKDDSRIWTISGNNFHQEYPLPYSYVFSYFGQSWGWASWKRCWNHFEHNFSSAKNFLKTGGFYNVFYNKKMGEHFNKQFNNRIKRKDLHTHAWDFYADFMVKSNGGLSIVPAKNLVTNIGEQGTHSSKKEDIHNRAVANNFCIEKEPDFVLPYYHYDNYVFNTITTTRKRIDKRVINRIIRFFNRK